MKFHPFLLLLQFRPFLFFVSEYYIATNVQIDAYADGSSYFPFPHFINALQFVIENNEIISPDDEAHFRLIPPEDGTPFIMNSSHSYFSDVMSSFLGKFSAKNTSIQFTLNRTSFYRKRKSGSSLLLGADN